MRLFRLFSNIVLKTVKNVKTWDYQIIWNGRIYVDAFWLCTVGKNPMFDIITNFVSTRISTVFYRNLGHLIFQNINCPNSKLKDKWHKKYVFCPLCNDSCWLLSMQLLSEKYFLFFLSFACKVVTPNLCFSVWAAPLPDVEQPTISHVAFEWMQFGSRNRKPLQDQAPDPEKSHDLRTSIWMK